ncbi:MAG: hypothetical protein G01um101433_942 [Parcubacteria group bacterium Gr01-1014_33]|nr:MAG: hypothetical protein G01um101433_942 [Parcubacteria group bacterium Gr01-1014_33]
MKKKTSYIWNFIIGAFAAGFLFVPGFFAFAQTPAPSESQSDHTAARAELAQVSGTSITTDAQAYEICDLEKYLADCAAIGKKYNLYSAEEIKQVDVVLTELKGEVVANLKSCTDEQCLITVATDLAKKIAARNPTVARALEITPAKVEEKKQIISAAEEAGVSVKDCREMDPDTAPVELLRVCARLAKDTRVEKYISPEARQAVGSIDTLVSFRESLTKGEYQCGDGTPDGCGNFCLNPSNQARAQGAPAIPAVCSRIAERFFGPEGVKELESSYQQVRQVQDFYKKKTEYTTFTTIDGRTIANPADIGKYLEEEGQKGNVEAVERGMDFLVTQGFINSQDKEFALAMIRKVREKGGIPDFDACSQNPKLCQDFIPNDQRKEFDAAGQIQEILKQEMGFDPRECARGQYDPSIGSRCSEGARRALPKLEALQNQVPEARFVVEKIKRDLGREDEFQKQKEQIQQSVRDIGGPGGCRSETDCHLYCSDATHGAECIAFGAQKQISGFRGEEAIQRFQQYQQVLQAPQYPGPYYGPLGGDGSNVQQGYQGYSQQSFGKEGQSPQGQQYYGDPSGASRYPSYPSQQYGYPNSGGFGGYPGGGQGPGPSPECFSAIQQGDFVRAKAVCTTPQNIPFPPRTPTPICAYIYPQPCGDGQYRKELRDATGCIGFGECVAIPGYQPPIDGIICQLAPATPCPSGHQRETLRSQSGCIGYGLCISDGGPLPPGDPNPGICPALPTVSSCPADQERVISYSSPNCGTYYMCMSRGTVPPPPGGIQYPYKFSNGKVVNSYDEAKAYCIANGLTNEQGLVVECQTRFGIYSGNQGGACPSYQYWYTPYDGTPGYCKPIDTNPSPTPTPGTPQCADGRDNDGDGAIDYPADTGCYGRDDWDEAYASTPPTPGISTCTQELINLLGTGCHQMYTDSSGRSIFCDGSMTKSAKQGDTTVTSGCTGPGGPTTPPGTPPPSGQREQIWNSLGLRSWIRSDASSTRIEQLKQACASVPAGANVWLPSAGDYANPDFGMPDSTKCQQAASCTSTQYFDGTSCVSTSTPPPPSGTPACSDGRDNDGDGAIDYPADTGCYGRDDWDEAYGTTPTPPPTSGTPACSDGRDNDADGAIDYPADTGCYGRDDWDEAYTTTPPPTSSSCPSFAHEMGGYCMLNGDTSRCAEYSSASSEANYTTTVCTQRSGTNTGTSCPSGQYWYVPTGGGAGYCRSSSEGGTTTGSCGTYVSQTSCASATGCYWSGSACVISPSSTSCPSGQYWYVPTGGGAGYCLLNRICFRLREWRDIFFHILSIRSVLERIGVCYLAFFHILPFGPVLVCPNRRRRRVLLILIMFVRILVGWELMRSNHHSASFLHTSFFIPMSFWLYMEWFSLSADFLFKLPLGPVLERNRVRNFLNASAITYSYSYSYSTTFILIMFIRILVGWELVRSNYYPTPLTNSASTLVLFHVSFIPLLEWICVCEHRQ